MAFWPECMHVLRRKYYTSKGLSPTGTNFKGEFWCPLNSGRYVRASRATGGFYSRPQGDQKIDTHGWRRSFIYVGK